MDVSVITVSVFDSQGRIVPVASNKIHFELNGPGKILGVGNGDPSCHEPDQFIPNTLFHTKAVSDWRWKRISNVYAKEFPEAAEVFDDSSWEKADVNSQSGPLDGQQNAMFRARIYLSPEELTTPSVSLNFGMIDEDGFVYVNGQRAGESHNWQDPATVDVKHFLHAGTNTIAVAVGNWNGAGGVNKGVSLQYLEKPSPVDWQRSVFNGYAQILVQSVKGAGEITLTAAGEGLKSSVLKLTTATNTR
jgi:beta-galactosidase